MVIRNHSQTHLSTFTKKHLEDHAKVIGRYSNNWQSKRFLFTSIFPSKIYINLSNFKNFIINQIKLILNPKIKTEINLIKKTLSEEKIKI